MRADVYAVYTAQAHLALEGVGARMEQAGLPPALTAHVTAEVALALEGVRLALASWTPRPPVEEDAEERALCELVDALLAARVNEVYAEVIARRDTTAGKTARALRAWNSERRSVTHDRPTHEQWLAMHDTPASDFETMDRVTNADGTFSFRYRIKPEPPQKAER